MGILLGGGDTKKSEIWFGKKIPFSLRELINIFFWGGDVKQIEEEKDKLSFFNLIRAR